VEGWTTVGADGVYVGAEGVEGWMTVGADGVYVGVAGVTTVGVDGE
jgi:hypothetical protein